MTTPKPLPSVNEGLLAAAQEGDDLAWLDEIEARASKATAGPWQAHEAEEGIELEADYCTDISGVMWGSFARVVHAPEGELSERGIANASFIAHARTDIPKLILALREALRSGVTQKAVTDEMVKRASAGVHAEWMRMIRETKMPADEAARSFVAPGNHRLVRAALESALTQATEGKNV